MQQSYSRLPMLKCDFRKVAQQLWHGCSPVNLLFFFKTSFTKNTSGWLLLLKVSSLDIWMHRRQLFCHNQGIYLDEYIQVTEHEDASHPAYSESLFLDVLKQKSLFFLFRFFSLIFTIHRTAGEEGGYLFISFLPLPLASQTFRHQPGYCCRELTSVQNWYLSLNWELLFS